VSKPFRWKGPGVFTDTVNGKAFQAGEGDIVHEHTVALEKLEQWAKAGIVEFINLVENVASRLEGKNPDDEDTKRLQANADRTNAVLRLTTLGELRILLSDRAFTDAERAEFESEQGAMSIEGLQRALESTQAEHKRRLGATPAPATAPAPEPLAPPDPTEEDMERLTNPTGDGAGPK
jgi:hypothetical protein